MSSYHFFVDSLHVRSSIPAALTIGLFTIFCLASVYVIREDLRHKRIPNWFNFALLISGLLLAPVLFPDFLTHYILAAITLVVFVILAELSGGGMGYGDVKLYTGLALFFGLLIVPIIALSNILALMAGMSVAVYKKQSIRKFPVPMAPFIILSTMICAALAA